MSTPRARNPRGQQWPNMRRDTYAAINDELVRARTKHPTRDNNMSMLKISLESLHRELYDYDLNRINEAQVFARAAQLAAMAIRILEEGSGGNRFVGTAGLKRG